MDTLLPGITAQRVPTSRLTVNMLSVTGRTGPAVLFVHGNVSSSLFWQPTMLSLPASFRPLAIDLRGFGDTDPEPVDATRGVRDFADDLAAAIDALGLESVHLAGWSMGAGLGGRATGRASPPGPPRFPLPRTCRAWTPSRRSCGCAGPTPSSSRTLP